MSDRFSRIPIERLLTWMLREEEQGSLFGIPRDLFFTPGPEDPFRMLRYGRLLETPVGVAAGPHTQLAQNIVSAWLTGARYIELKTVQTLDEIDVAKPCIDMADVGYNCEWSQELKLGDSLEEYVNAWILIHLLRDKWGWSDPGRPGVIFNMSLGYDLAGIRNPNVQAFVDGLLDAGEMIRRKLDALVRIYPRAADLDIPSLVSDNVTLSTMHGCPPDEIESIGRYLIEERHLHTAVKLNPTLLGPDHLRSILNDTLGYSIEVPDVAFEHDLKFTEALKVIRSLEKSAKKVGVEFGLKLTNTLEVLNKRRVLPADQKMNYMSGRALHPISVHVANRLQDAFDGRLDISFSAGADCYNTADILACGIKPVTTCSDLLKPGGYTRLGQYLEEIEGAMIETGATHLSDFILARSRLARTGGKALVREAAKKNLAAYSKKVLENPAFHASRNPYDTIKTLRRLDSFDCVQAPCVNTCAVNQDIPEYMYWTAQGDYRKAYDVILRTNPFPRITGKVCDHLCQSKCTRITYDDPLLIREIKRFIAAKHPGDLELKPGPANGFKVAILGAGPSGLACAYFLALEGFGVDVFEGKDLPGGMASDAIPTFRLDDESIKRDVAAIEALGVSIHYNAVIDRKGFEELREAYDYVYIAVGAQKGKRLGLTGEDVDGVWDQLEFLSAVRRGKRVHLGKQVVVIGGGNSAMDAARTAHRLVGRDGKVTVVYRRTRREMPADRDEVQALLNEGVRLMELTAPNHLVVRNERVRAVECSRMELGEPDESGRPRPIPLEDSAFEMEVDSIITALGQIVDVDFLPDRTLRIDSVTGETQYDKVYAGGDAVRGASSLIRAIGDGKHVAETILRRATGRVRTQSPYSDKGLSLHDYQKRQARRVPGQPMPEIAMDDRRTFKLVHPLLDEVNVQREASRCLYCSDVCSICVSVCPNRANVTYPAKPLEIKVQRAVRNGEEVHLEPNGTFRVDQPYQVLNIADFCNECGNCTTFCPTAGDPWKDKPRFHLNEEAFRSERDGYFFKKGVLHARVRGRDERLSREKDALIYKTDEVRAIFDPSGYAVRHVDFTSDKISQADFSHAARMIALFTSLSDFHLFAEA